MTRSRVTCLDCGAAFVRPNGYQGNYCPDCHESWTDEHDADPEPRPLGGRTTPSVRHRDDEEADAPPRYDEREE